MKKEIIFDKILRKFEGTKTFHWDDIHKKEFYQDIHPDYFVVENHLNFLIGDGVLKEDVLEKRVSLSRRGVFVMTNSDTDGYRAKKEKENKKKNWTIILGIISIATFILVVIRFSNDFFISPKSKTELDTNEVKKQTIPNESQVIDTTIIKSNIKADSVK